MMKKAFTFFILLSSATTATAFVIQPQNQKHVAGFATSKSRKTPIPPSLVSLSQSQTNNDQTTQDKTMIMKKNSTKEATAAPLKKAMGIFAASFLMISNLISPFVAVEPAFAAESRLVGEIRGSGLVFKDTLNIESFEDPKVRGVTLYISNFQRPLTERLQKDFFSDPSQAAVGCAKTGEISIADNIAMGKQGEEVFEEKRSLLFKELKVQRIYDQEKNTVIYVSFNTRLDKSDDTNKSRFKSSICAVNLD
eukprot:CAMPEP_0185724592 /NCGR_PEP_ID=MMETSP1171-20130828/1026_1 /TAXON_ID=374046 /ORGANISM="Helicotheca tamensis, Strain CCMP826" /LENGTH=250 /DNA_ID=CAMNT_0028392473 /DNA_START=104 /DNA_END=856 /DNA_ORIENTATION=-